MPATESNRKALEEFIKKHYKNTCKTKVPLHFRDEVRAELEACVKKGVLESPNG